MKIFTKNFLAILGTLLFLTILIHMIILIIAPSKEILINNTHYTNVNISKVSEFDMSRLILETLVETLPISLLCCGFISFFAAILLTRYTTTPILSISSSVEQMIQMDKEIECTIQNNDEIGDLARNINILYKELFSTIQKLENEKKYVEKVDQEKINFLRVASHELKTPITELNLVLENMILKIGEYSNYEYYLTRCKEITNNMGNMIKKVLDMSKVQIEHYYEYSQINLVEYVSDISEGYRLIAKAKGINYIEHLDSNMTIDTSPDLLRKAISNILSNAVNYTSSKKQIIVNLQDNEMSIKNECIPLTDAELKKVFEPFYKVSDFIEESSSNGIGLYIVQDIFTRLGIKFDFKSANDIIGMEFTIYFF